MARVGSVRVVLNEGGFMRVNTGPVLGHVRDIAQTGASLGRATSPKRTGELARSIRATPGSANQFGAFASIRIGAKHAQYVMYGTVGPITANGRLMTLKTMNPRLLPPVGRGSPYFTRGAHNVTHALSVRGQRPNPFMQTALRVAMARHGH